MQKIDVTHVVLAGYNTDTDHSALLSLAHRLGLARIVKTPDPDYSFADLCGDTYNPQANPDIDPEQLKREKAAFRSRVNRQGVWGLMVEVRETCRDDWGNTGPNEVDSIWGFVGDDYINSGHDKDFVIFAAEWLADKVSFTDLIGLASKARDKAHVIYESSFNGGN